MPTPRKKRTGKKRPRRRARPYVHSKRKHRHRRRVVHHRAAMAKEAETMNYLLHNMLKTMSKPAGEYHYHPRHHSRDPEYRWSSARMKEFKRGFPAPDTHSWRAPAPESDTWTGKPYRGNF